MKTSDFFTYLDENISASDQKEFLQTIRQDSILWKAFQEVPVLIKLSEKYGNSVADWTLKRLCFTNLGLSEQILTKPVKEKLYLSKAIKVLDSVRNGGMKVSNISDSSLLALALYERGIKKKNWTGLIKELTVSSDFSRIEFFLNWRTAFAILFSLLDYDEKLLEDLADEADEYLAFSLINHIIAVQLISEKDKANILRKLIDNSTQNQQISWYQLIGSQLGSLRKQFLDFDPQSKVLNPGSNDGPINNLNNMDESIKKNLRNGYISLLENSNIQANTFFKTARDVSKNLLDTIEMLCLETDLANRIIPEFKENLSNTPKYQDILYSKTNDFVKDGNEVRNSFENCGILEKLQLLVKMKSEGEEKRAEELASIEFNNWLVDRQKNWPALDEIVYLQGLDHIRLLELANELNLSELEVEYLEFLEIISKNQKFTDKASLKRTMHFADNEKLYEISKVNLIINPDDIENRKRLIRVLNKEKDWNTLFTEWEKLEEKVEFDTDEWLNYAKSACESNHLDKSLNLCNQLSQIGVEEGEINSIKGNIALRKGEIDKAVNLLNESINSVSNNKDAWLTLARIYHQEDKFDDALATLRSAVLAVPDSDEVHAMLANVCLEKNLFSEALPYLRKAIALDSENENYYVKIISTLKELGRTEEAYQILNKARQNWPNQSEIAYLEAQKQIDDGNREPAILALKTAIQNNENPPKDWLMTYSKILMNENDDDILFTDFAGNNLADLIAAQQSLQQVIKISNDYYARLLLGEVYYMLGETEAAHSMYLQLVNLDQNGDEFISENIWRIKAGLGLVKIALNDIESGLVLLKEAAALKPNQIGLKHKLADVYFKAGLEDLSINVAKEAIEAAGTNINNLIWYANFMGRLNQKEEVVSALEQAYQLSQQNSKLICRLATEYVATGKTENAKEILNEMISSCIGDSDDYRNATIIYLRIGMNLNALKAYELSLEPNNKIGLEQQIELVYLKTINGLWTEALPISQDLVERHPNFRLFLSLEAECLTGLKQDKNAMYAYEQALTSERLTGELIRKSGKMNLFVPSDWIERHENIENLLVLISQSSSKVEDFQNSLKYIDHAIKLNPENNAYYLIGFDLSLQLNDYELANKYKLALSGSNLPKLDESSLSIMQGLLIVHSIFTDRENKIDTKVLNLSNPLANYINVFNILNKGDFTKARDLFETSRESDKTEDSLPFDVLYNKPLFQVWNNTIFRIKTLTAMRLNEYSIAYETIDIWQKKGGCNLEISYYKANLMLEYSRISQIFEELNVQEHRNSDLDEMVNNQTFLSSNLEIANRQGKTKAIKDVETITINHDDQDATRLQSILLSPSFPSRLKYIVVGDLMKLEKYELVEHYLSTLSSQEMDILIYSGFDLSKRSKEIIKLIEEKSQICNPLIYKILSNSYSSITNFTDAIIYSEKAINCWENELNWLIDHANLHEIIGDIATSLEIWKTVVEKSKHKEAVIYSYMNLLLRLNNSKEVLDLLKENKKILFGSFEYFHTYAKAFFQIGNYEKSLKSIQDAKKIQNFNIELELLEGSNYFNLEDYDGALRVANEIINVEPEFDKSYLLKISVYQKMNKIQEAIKSADQGLKLCMNSVALKMAKASLLRLTNRETDALQIVSQISNTEPSNYEALSLLAQLYADLGDISAAESTAKKSLRISQNQPEIQLLLGKILSKQGNLDQALEYLSKSAALVPENVEPCLEIGQVYLGEQNLSDAINAFKEAINRNPNDYRAYYQAGLIMKEIKDYQGSEKMLNIAAKLAPKDASIRRQLAGVMALNFVHSPMEVN